ncbi:amino acid adenylation domain-containing protein [Streptomyces sp. NPDC059918]|uniref:amino acid adenylation domain-containing protein n=1 Tax=unclassified Streptomyces TaxID=2593676 RepID=UPI00364A9699
MSDHTSDRHKSLAERLRAARAKQVAERQAHDGVPADGIPPRAADAPAVLSYEQRRIWLVDHIYGESRDYNVPQCVLVDGDFDEQRFEAAFEALTARHEILRTVFREAGGEPQPVVLPPGSAAVGVTDLCHLGEATAPELMARVLEEAAAEADRPFRLAVEPPVRASVLRCGERLHVIVLTVHHIATDGPSMELIWRELSDHYAAATSGREAHREPPRLEYADFAAWERDRHRTGTASEAADLAYWTGALAGLHEDPLPIDLPRTHEAGRSGAEVTFTVPADVSERLGRLAVECGATPFMAVLAGVKALLAAAGGLNDIVVGSPISGRNREELEELLGPCMNVLPLRTDLGGGPSFLELIRRVRETTLGAFSHQDLPFARMVEELRPERVLGKNPLFQVMFTHGPRQRMPLDIAGASVRPVEIPVSRSKFDLSITLTEEAGTRELSGSLVYATDLFEPDTVRALAERFVLLLRVATEHPRTALDRLPLYNPHELHTLIHRWGRGERRDTRSHPLLPGGIVAQAARTPDAVAVSCAGVVLTYAELERRSARLARELRRRAPLSQERPVGICLRRSADLVVAMLAVLRAGGCYVPIDPELPADRIGYMLQDSGVRYVLVQRATLDAAPWNSLGVELHGLDADVPVTAAGGSDPLRPEPEPEQDPGRLAYTIYTSGSTGRPKGVMVSHRALANFAADMVERLALRGSDVVAALTTVSFDIAALELLVPLTAGARVEIFSRDEAADGTRLGALLGSRGVTVLQATPAGWALLVAAGWPGGNLRAVCGGEALPHRLAAEIRARASELWHVYGPTETTVWSTAHRVDAGPQTGTGPSLGRPLLNTSAYVLDPRLSPVPIGAVGELYIGGAGVARGYAGRPALTAERFLPDPFVVGEDAAGARMYATGDLVRYRQSGHLEFLGRRDHQVKIRGHRIEPGEIEARLAEHPSVEHAAVKAAGEGADQYLVAYVVTGDRDECPAGDILRQLRGTLPAYMIPQRIVALDRLPLTAGGKVDRKALPSPAPLSSADAYAAPVTELEHGVAQVWADVLGVERVGLHDDFFALGGHSLRAAQLVALLRERLSVVAEVRLVFEAPTVREFASALDTERTAEPLAAGTGAGPAPLSYTQQRLWFLDRLRPGRTDYHVASSLRITGPLDRGALERAGAEVLTRHDVLRSRFESTADGPVVAIDPVPAPWLAFADVSALDAAAAEAEAARRAQEELGLPFDLERGPLLRGRLLRISEHEHLLVVVMHHAVVDGWSLELFWGEVSQAYRAFAVGVSPELPELTVQFADFARWEKQTDTTADLEYWRGRLEGSDATEIPPDRVRPPEFDNAGAAVSFEIPAELRQRLAEMAQQLGTTPFVVHLSAFMAALARLTGRSDLVVGTPIAGSGRQRPELIRLIGPFLNTVALRASLSPDESFATGVAAVREAVVGAAAHQDLPFEQLVQALAPHRDMGRHPLFQIGFAMDTDETASVDLPGLDVEEFPLPNPTTKFDLSLVLRDRREGLAGSLIFATALYDPETARGIADLYVRLLAEAAARPHAPLARLRLLDDAAAERLAPVRHRAPADDRVHELVEARAGEQPDAIAVEQSGEVLTYRELNARADQLAEYLRNCGASAGRFVGVALPHSFDLVVALLAVLKTGAAYVPVDPGQPTARNAALLAQAGVFAVLVPEGVTDLPLPPGVRLLGPAWTLGAVRAEPTPRVPVRVLPADIAYVTFTSGSTGRPKAVPATHASVTGYLRHLVQESGLGAFDTVLQLAAISFDAATRDILGTLTAGARLVLLPTGSARDPRAILREVQERRVTALLSTVPSLLTALALSAAAGPEAGLPGASLRLVLVSGEKLKPEVARRALLLGPDVRLVNLYGPTECTMTSTAHQVTGEDLAAGHIPIGVPAPGVRALVLDPVGEPLPTGATGELYIGGPRVSYGYLGAPGLTAEAYVPDPFGPSGSRLYRTGDLVHWDHRGRLIYHGRIDHQIKVRGVRVEPGEVEGALLDQPGVREAAVVVNDPGGELVAWIVADADTGTDDGLRRLRHAMAERLPEQMRPTHYMRRDELPRTPHGKLDRGALARCAPVRTPQTAVVPPRNRLELQLLGIWEKVLRQSPIGIRDDFFEAGGHSLKAVELMAQTNKILGVDLPLHTFFRRPTVEGLAAAVTAAADDDPETRNRLVVPLNDMTDDAPPLFLVHPQSGDVCCYVDLVRELGEWRRVYGIEAVGYSNDAPPLESIEAIAARYVEEIRAVAPHGPYLLGGWSFGGSVVVEMAAALEAAAEEVAFLALIDARAFGQDDLEEWYVSNTELVRFGLAHGMRDDDLPTDDEAVLAVLTRHLHDIDRTTDYADSGAVRRMIDVFTVNGRAADNYRPQTVVAAPLHVFRATERHPTLTNPLVRPESWQSRTKGAVHVIELPGNHHDLASPPHVKVFAERLRHAVDQSDARQRSVEQ